MKHIQIVLVSSLFLLNILIFMSHSVLSPCSLLSSLYSVFHSGHKPQTCYRRTDFCLKLETCLIVSCFTPVHTIHVKGKQTSPSDPISSCPCSKRSSKIAIIIHLTNSFLKITVQNSCSQDQTNILRSLLFQYSR